MLLVTLTINGTDNYLSIEGHALTHYWKNKIISFDPPQMMLPYKYGGYCKTSFGNISLTPDIFDDNWTPPINGDIKIQYSDTTEEVAETVFSGTAHLESINREEVTYGIYGPNFDETIADATAYNDTLNNVLTTILTTISEISSVNTDDARASSPNVTHTTSCEQLAIELASEIAATYTHLFYIIGSIAYLVDMKGYKNSGTITEFDFFPANYSYDIPTSIARSGDYNQNSSYAYGNEISVDQYHTTQANIETYLSDVLSIVNRPKASIAIPFLGNLPNPGKKLSWRDESQGSNVDVDLYVRNIRYDFSNDQIELDGDCEINSC